MPEEIRRMFPDSPNIDFDVKAEHALAKSSGQRPKVVMELSRDQHIRICMENSTTIEHALMLADLLKEEIEFRVRVFTRCLGKASESYVKWLQDDYKLKLKLALIRNAHRFDLPE